MQSMRLTTHIENNGMLKIQLPPEIREELL